MVDKQTIIHKHRVIGTSQRGISRELGLSRDTVRKVIAEYEVALVGPNPDEALEAVLITPPRYKGTPRPRRVLTGEVREQIDKWLDDNTRKRATGFGKQCMRATDIHEQLTDRGYEVSYPSVSKYIASASRRHQEQKSREAFIRAEHPPGEACEFDWCEVKLRLGGKSERLYMAVFALSHSNGRWAWLFHHQNTLAFLESHRNFFRHVRGVPQVMVYDNMKVAVRDFTGGDKKPTEALLRLGTFYRFGYRFCNARAGWEKGNVERSVELIRRKAFCVRDSFATLGDAQAHLLTVCERINGRSGSGTDTQRTKAIREDLAALTPCIHDMGCFETERYKVDKWSTVCMKGSHYSVPDTLVGKTLDVRIYSERIALFADGVKVASHERLHRQGGWAVDIEHYTGTLLRKPGAVASSVALRQMPEKIRSIFDLHFRECPREFVLLLQYARDNGFTHGEIAEAAATLRKRGLRALSADRIKVMLHHGREQGDISRGAVVMPLDRPHAEQHDGIVRGAARTLAELSRMMEGRNNDTPAPQPKSSND